MTKPWQSCTCGVIKYLAKKERKKSGKGREREREKDIEEAKRAGVRLAC